MNDAVRPFRLNIPDEQLTDLKARLRMTRLPPDEVVDDWSQGTPRAYMEAVCAYWAEEYDWRTTEARLNAIPQFITNLDGVDIHFLHVRSPHEEARPLLLTHGWPGSVVEFLNVLEPLSNPTSHGGNAEDAFHLVVPALPGYGFSGKPTTTGWGVEKIAEQWDALMRRLGYERYFAQGGDWGAAVTTAIGIRQSEGQKLEEAALASTSTCLWSPPTKTRWTTSRIWRKKRSPPASSTKTGTAVTRSNKVRDRKQWAMVWLTHPQV